MLQLIFIEMRKIVVFYNKVPRRTSQRHKLIKFKNAYVSITSNYNTWWCCKQPSLKLTMIVMGLHWRKKCSKLSRKWILLCHLTYLISFCWYWARIQLLKMRVIWKLMEIRRYPLISYNSWCRYFIGVPCRRSGIPITLITCTSSFPCLDMRTTYSLIPMISNKNKMSILKWKNPSKTEYSTRIVMMITTYRVLRTSSRLISSRNILRLLSRDSAQRCRRPCSRRSWLVCQVRWGPRSSWRWSTLNSCLEGFTTGSSRSSRTIG